MQMYEPTSRVYKLMKQSLTNLQCELVETSKIIYQLQDENCSNHPTFWKPYRIPRHPNKDKYKLGIKDIKEDSDPDGSSI
ncbi:5164_t:CDS:2 [Gigaspora rosea]|nr:5164_t:CDS:2 [Gigaspora rosea]